RALGVLGIIIAAWVAWPQPVGGSEVEWQPLSVRALDRAIAARRPVIVEFSASWCLPFREMESSTFINPQVVHESARFSMLQADVTESNALNQALMQKFAVMGVPTIIFYDAHGSEVDRVVGYLDASRFVQKMRRIESPQPDGDALPRPAEPAQPDSGKSVGT